MLIPLLRCHVDMLERVGVEGMSSDESDTEEAIGNAYVRRNNTRYRAKQPVWQAIILDAWLRVFDTCYVLEFQKQSNPSAWCMRAQVLPYVNSFIHSCG